MEGSDRGLKGVLPHGVWLRARQVFRFRVDVKGTENRPGRNASNPVFTPTPGAALRSVLTGALSSAQVVRHFNVPMNSKTIGRYEH